jgi:hypothetical protein
LAGCHRPTNRSLQPALVRPPGLPIAVLPPCIPSHIGVPHTLLHSHSTHTQELRSYSLNTRGLAGCGLDPLAPVGTNYVIDLWTWDAGKANATTRRIVSIVDPCPSNSSSVQYFCKDVLGRSVHNHTCTFEYISKFRFILVFLKALLENMTEKQPASVYFPARSYYCSPLSCDVSALLMPPPHLAPVIQLLPLTSGGDATAFVEFGRVPPLFLGVCSS